MRGYCHLDYEARRKIERYANAGFSMRRIALVLGVSPSTVSRELRRNSHRAIYLARHAQAYYEARKFLSAPTYRGQLIFRCSSVGVCLCIPKTDRLLTAWASDYRNARYRRNGDRPDSPYRTVRRRRASLFAVWHKPIQPRLMKLKLQHYGQKETPPGEVNPFGDPPKFWETNTKNSPAIAPDTLLCA
ncbi:helix-turn-helix domain-containing protein [Fulvitalea axinellae]|uniref:helix-turn-helix domain-containing protein n=1 Tax=Fulvitalea axinellae TaxID=1182444 RepID=UPI003BAA00F4